ncbi:MAG: YebC/PmpR family DNA-binding transcriptional regulator [Bacteroides sp.]|nr:YebC/PmpR family DNA-binding transcriptional regulator [Bacteroides sp.]
MGRAFEYRKASKLKRWGNMARVFTRIGKQIAIAVKAGGPDPENNPHLRSVIANAKRENMPKDNIERAIKNALGKDQKDYKEMNYEGYGPFGVAVFVETATDNTTRTVANVRSVFNKYGGSLGTSGSLDFIFSHKAMFTIARKEDVDLDDLILELIDYGVDEEYEDEGDEVILYGDPKSFSQIQKYLEENGYEIKGSEFTRIPNDEKELTAEQRETIEKMVERLEEDEDVQNVYTNLKPVAEEE